MSDDESPSGGAGMLGHALDLARQGYRVFPVKDKRPAIKDFSRRLCYYQLATDATSVITRWWTRHPDRNLGVAPGPRLVILDVEDDRSLAWLGERLGEPAEALLNGTRSVRTGGGGFHLYFRCEALYANRCRVFDQKIDLRTWGGFVLAPPSRSSKDIYTYIHQCEPARLLPVLREMFAGEGLVRLGAGMARPAPPPAREPVGWDKDECAAESREEAGGSPPGFHKPLYPVSSSWSLSAIGEGPAGGGIAGEVSDATGSDEPLYPVSSSWLPPEGFGGWFRKSRQLVLRFPITGERKRDAQQGVMLAHLVRTQRPRGRRFVRLVARRWLYDQRERFRATLEEAYAHLDRSLERAWNNERLAGPTELDYLRLMGRQWIPSSPLLEAQRGRRGDGRGRLLEAILRVSFWKLLCTDEDAIRVTNQQLSRLSGLSRAQFKRLKGLYISRPGKPATALRVLVEREAGHRDEAGRAVPSAFDLDDDWVRLAFPQEGTGDGPPRQGGASLGGG